MDTYVFADSHSDLDSYCNRDCYGNLDTHVYAHGHRIGLTDCYSDR